MYFNPFFKITAFLKHTFFFRKIDLEEKLFYSQKCTELLTCIKKKTTKLESKTFILCSTKYFIYFSYSVVVLF